MSLSAPALEVDRSSTETKGNGPAELSTWNKVNLGVFLVSLVVINVMNVGLVGTNGGELSRRYQVLVTPASKGFAGMWPVIFLLELIFCIAQMTPAYRGNKLIPVVGPWFVSCCVCQSAWSIVFAFELIEASSVLIVLAFLSLVGLCWFADKVEGISVCEFWLLRAGFSIHLGWLLAASVVNTNRTFDYNKASMTTLIAVAIASLAGVFTVAALYALAHPKPDAGVCLVAAWATYWISQELANPTRLLATDKFNPQPWDESTVKGIGMAAYILCIASLGLAGIALLRRMCSSCETNAAPASNYQQA